MPPHPVLRHTGVALATLASACLTAAPGLRAQDRAPTGESAQESTEAAPQAQTPPQDEDQAIHPDAVSRFVERRYSARPKKMWKGLLQTLKDAGDPPEQVDEARMHVKTSFVDFEAKDFPDPVVDPPPLFGPDYPIVQLNRVRGGKVSLEAIVVAEKHETVVSVRARILVNGVDRRRRIHVLTDRRSSGAIEKQFLDRLEKAIGIEPR